MEFLWRAAPARPHGPRRRIAPLIVSMAGEHPPLSQADNLGAIFYLIHRHLEG